LSVEQIWTLAWQKFKLSLSQEFVIGGYNPDGNTFSSLLLGYYDKGQLKSAGKVRQGFNPASRRALLKVLQPLAVKRCPFVNLSLSKTGHFGEGITKGDMETPPVVEAKQSAASRFYRVVETR
jgi:bifunctional non-homologous end joining protein LigD